MWKPAVKIKYEPQPGPWPSATEAETSLLFSPVDIGALSLRERTWVPAMVPWRATEDGEVTDAVLGWYERFAQGKPGAIVVEATGIRDIPSGPLLRIGHDRFLPGLRELVQTVREASAGRTRLLIQIIDFLAVRRRPKPEKYFQRYLRLTDRHRTAEGAPDGDDQALRDWLQSLPDPRLDEILDERELESLRYGYRERVTDTHLPQIEELPRALPKLFADAAQRARTAGFDGVELHYAHAYTMASFLSRRNTRTDGYGGSRENRCRAPLEVYRAVRGRVGDDYTVGCRFLSRDCIEAGSDVDEASYFATEFARAGMDFLSLSRGGKFEDAKQPRPGWAVYPYTGPSGYECMPAYISDEQGPFGRNLADTAAIRAAVRAAGFDTPIIAAGGLHGYAQAEAVLRDGQADVVGAARQSLADPDWFRKMRLGRGEEVRTCEYTNYCEGLDQKHKPVTCKLWDREDLENAPATTPDGKRRLTAPVWNP